MDKVLKANIKRAHFIACKLYLSKVNFKQILNLKSLSGDQDV